MKEHPNNTQYSATIGFLRRGYSTTGGAEAYLSRLAEGLLSQGYRVILFGTGDWPKEAWPGGEVVVLPRTSLRTFGKAVLDYQQKSETPCDLLFSMERVPGCDIFRAGDGVHAAWLERRGKNQSFWKRWLVKHMSQHGEVLALEQALFSHESKTHIIANSAMVAREITEYFDFPEAQITTIPNGVPPCEQLTKEERYAARDILGIKKEECVVLFVGSGWKRKGLETAIQAVKEASSIAPSMRLWVAGRGKAKSTCEHAGAHRDG